MLYTKFQPNISSGSGEKVDFSGFAIFLQHWPFLIQDQIEFYHSDTLQPFDASYEI